MCIWYEFQIKHIFRKTKEKKTFQQKTPSKDKIEDKKSYACSNSSFF